MVLRVRAVAALLLVLFFFAAGQSASQQAPARDTPRPRGGAARVAGRVVAADSGMPVRRAVVRLSSTDTRYSGMTLTDSDGNYEFRDLPEGAFRISVSKDAYIPAFFGADRRYPTGRTLRVQAGENVRNASIAIARSCAISGHVYDEFGDPLAKADIMVFRRQPDARHRIFAAPSARQPSEARTDDLGQYRVFGLEPGDYYVQALPNRNQYRDLDATLDAGFLLPSFYPGSSDASQAQPVRVASGQDATSIDFMVGSGRTARISGTVLDAAGRRAAGAHVYAEFDLAPEGMTTPAATSTAADGSFVLGPLAPGNYIVGAGKLAEGAQNPNQVDRGGVRLSLAGADLPGVTIQLTAGSSISGRVVADGTRRLASFAGVSIGSLPVDPTDPLSSENRQGLVREDGSFMLPSLFGEQVISVTTPGGWAVKAIYAGGRDILDTAVNFDRGQPITGAQVVLTDRLTRLIVSATASTGANLDAFYLLVASDDPARWAPAFARRFVRGAASPDGAPVTVDALPPGDYFAVAFDAEQSLSDLADPGVMTQLRTAAQRFRLGEGETKTIALKVSGQTP